MEDHPHLLSGEDHHQGDMEVVVVDMEGEADQDLETDHMVETDPETGLVTGEEDGGQGQEADPTVVHGAGVGHTAGHAVGPLNKADQGLPMTGQNQTRDHQRETEA